MNKRDIIHLIIGKNKNIGPKTKTGCKQLLMACGSGVTYQYRQGITCACCQQEANAIANLRNEQQIAY